MLNIINLHVKIEEKEILKGLNLSISKNEIHAIMGPNGSGKSTLAKSIIGYPGCIVTEGKIEYEKNNEKIQLTDMPPEDRALAGIFLGYQHPLSIPGVSNIEFLKIAYNNVRRKNGLPILGALEFQELVSKKIEKLGINKAIVDRPLNVGLSGGEKKKNELLQLAILEPNLAILDEIDSGLDVDSLQSVANNINMLKAEKSILLITHYERILKYIVPDYVHIMYRGKIVKSGGKELAYTIERDGYKEFLKDQDYITRG